MTIWYMHLMISNVNWWITSIFHLITLVYNVGLYLRFGEKDEILEIKVTAILTKSLVCLIYIWMSFFSDQQKKLNYTIH